MEEHFEFLSLNKVLIVPTFYSNLIKTLLIYIILYIAFSKILSKDKEYKNILNMNNVKHDFEKLVNKYKHLIKHEENIPEDSPIWMMWYQGIEKAPPIVLSCIQSVMENRANHPVIIITKNNLKKYIKLPYYIFKKFKEGMFDITHFSDIIRMALLHKYGGYWIDSTYLITAPIKNYNTSFYTLKLNYCWTYDHPFINCKWSVNFMAFSKNSFIANYGYNALLYYWKKYNSVIDYFLLDYIIYIAYHKLPKFKKLITDLPYVNCRIFSLVQALSSEYNKLDLICAFNKLTRGGVWLSLISDKKTNYGYIIDRYILDFKNINEDVGLK